MLRFLRRFLYWFKICVLFVVFFLLCKVSDEDGKENEYTEENVEVFEEVNIDVVQTCDIVETVVTGRDTKTLGSSSLIKGDFVLNNSDLKSLLRLSLSPTIDLLMSFLLETTLSVQWALMPLKFSFVIMSLLLLLLLSLLLLLLLLSRPLNLLLGEIFFSSWLQLTVKEIYNFLILLSK